MIYYVHAESVSPRAPGTCRACVRVAHRAVPGHRRPLRDWPGHVDALGATATRDRDRRSARQGRGLGVAGRLGGTQAVDRRQARPDVRGTHPGVQPRGAVWSGTSLQHLASAPPDRVCLQKKTIAAGRARSGARPSRARGVPRLGPDDRGRAPGLSRRIGRECGDGPVARVVAARAGTDRAAPAQLGRQT